MSPMRLTPSDSSLDRRPPSLTLAATVLFVLFLLLLSSPLLRAQTRTPLSTRVLAGATTDLADAGPMPASEPIELTLRLAPTGAQADALDSVLAEQIQPTSGLYHQWLTPAAFGAKFGASDDQIAAVTAWASAQGLSINSVAPSRNRITLEGGAAQIEAAFSVELHRFISSTTTPHYAAVTEPSLPSDLASLVAGVSGLDNLPAPRPTTVGSLTGTSLLADPLAALASLVDSNTSAVVTVTTSACTTDLVPSEIAAYRDLVRQANAQGITVLSTSACGARGSGSFPASLAEVTALAITPSDTPTSGIDTRPFWQAAPGLPSDGMRREPDLETSSIADYTRTVAAILEKTGSRQGNMNRNLYAFAPIPGLYSQPETGGTEAATASVADSLSRTTRSAERWQSSTGLGMVNLKELLKAYSSGTTATSISLSSTSYDVFYGNSITLTSVISPSATGATLPSGTVTFSSTQGTLGSSAVNSNTAILTVATLPVGTNAISATYSGDSTYAASSGTANVYVRLVDATVAATISPSANIPYGSTATVTATVSLPNSNGIAANGLATASIQGLSNATYSNTLTSNGSTNTATTNIVLSAPPPYSAYTVSVTCMTTTNYTCLTPVNLPFATVKGISAVTVSSSPVAPEAGQPITLTATAANAGNGTGAYTFSGSVSFYDNGALLATAAVASNQATTTKLLAGNVTHSIVAVYTGDTNWSGSTSPAVAITPTLLPSSLVLSTNMGNGASALAGADVVFTGTVSTNATGTAGPTGTVTLFDTFNGSVVQIGSPSATVANGSAAAIALFSTTGLLAGTHSVYATYSGDANFAPVTSPVFSLTIADYGLSMVPSTLTLTGGTSASVATLLNVSGGFAGTVSFGCTPPAGSEATCSFSPSSLASGGVTTMTIQTTSGSSATSSNRRPQMPRSGSGVGFGLSLATVLLVVLPRRRYSGLRRVVLGSVAVVLLGVSGCGQGSTGSASSSTGNTGSASVGTPLGTMNFMITAAGSNGVNTSRHTYQYQVTVQ